MAYVSIPKDLTKVKNKVVFNLTKRQIICLGVAVVLGLPFYFLTRNYIGTSNAATGMVLLMLPEFLFAMYEKDGLPLEKILMNMLNVRFRRPAIRRYETKNMYEEPDEKIVLSTKKGGHPIGKKQTRRKARQAKTFRQTCTASKDTGAEKTDFRAGVHPLP